MVQIDTNLFEDLIRKRQGWQASSAVINLIKQGKVAGSVSAWTVATIYYFRRQSGLDDTSARLKTSKVLEGFTVLGMTAEVTNRALDDNRFHFEDALQFHTAQENSVDVFVTRNVRHFEVVKGRITILKPEEFLAQIGRTNYGN